MKNYFRPLKRRTKKQHFQLLEVMIAMFLVVLCAVPALEIYVGMYKEQAQVVRDYESDHLVHLMHAKIVEQMHQKYITLEDILRGEKRSFDDPALSAKLKKMGYRASYTFQIEDPTFEVEEATSYLSNLTIELEDRATRGAAKAYRYLLFIDKGHKAFGTKGKNPVNSGLNEDQDENVDQDTPNNPQQGAPPDDKLQNKRPGSAGVGP